ncbi:MAG: hypothetical protein NUV51_09655, partial [Sulfuricaulis sp.]|nr:hypothetical protein [Sulfuricaulis sp.]
LVQAQSGGAATYQDLGKALIAFAMEKYYTETTADPSQQEQLFTAVTGGLQFDTTRIAADITTAKGYAQYFSGYLDSTLFFTVEECNLIRSKIADLKDWSIAVGSSGMTATDSNNQGAFMLGNFGSDTLTGGAATDLLVGGRGSDTLNGGDGNDTLLGGANNDTLTGGIGDDTLTGGAGNDTYQYTTGDGSDTITDKDGSIVFDSATLSGGTRNTGETLYHSQDGTYSYEWSGGDLTINGTITVNNFSNNDLGIHLDETEDPADPPKPPVYDPNNARRFVSSSPLALDINNNGRIDDIGLANSTVYFDLTEDGVAEKSGWLAPEDGLLALDINGNGVVDDRGELFGTDPQHTAFDRMAELVDFNQDGIVDASDSLFGQLRVWQDANSDGISQAGELKTLDELGITSIDTAQTRVVQPTGNGNSIIATGSYIRNGQQQYVVDIEFAYDPALTDANPNRPLDQPPTLDSDVYQLP